MEELRRIRKDKGLTQRDLAAASGVDKATISLVESGKRRPHLETLDSLAAVLEVEIGDFFPKAQAPLPFEEGGGGGDSSFLEPNLWREYALHMADFYGSLAEREAPGEQVEGWGEVVWWNASYVVAIVETIDELVRDGTFTDDDGDRIPLLKATLYMANQANRVIRRALAGPDRDVEREFWKIVGGMNLTTEQREEILA